MPARPYVSGHFQLVLDGVDAGLLKSVEGGGAAAEVISEMVSSSLIAKKHLGPISYSPFVMEFALPTTADLSNWINASWSGKAIARNGAVVQADQNLVAQSQREFSQALITETTFPALEGGSKQAAYLRLTLAPELTRTAKASGKLSAKTGQKTWLASNFKVSIDGLDCTRISKVDSFTVKQTAVAGELGQRRLPQRQPGRLEFPNLTITLAEVSAKSWFDWFETFVIKGDNGEAAEKSGSIVLLGANLTEELLRIDLFNVGIFSIGQDRAEASSDKVATVSARLYCERMELTAGAAPKAIVRAARAPRRTPSRARASAGAGLKARGRVSARRKRGRL